MNDVCWRGGRATGAKAVSRGPNGEVHVLSRGYQRAAEGFKRGVMWPGLSERSFSAASWRMVGGVEVETGDQ